MRFLSIVKGIACTTLDRKSTRLNSSHITISYAVFCLKKKKHSNRLRHIRHITLLTTFVDYLRNSKGTCDLLLVCLHQHISPRLHYPVMFLFYVSTLPL